VQVASCDCSCSCKLQVASCKLPLLHIHYPLSVHTASPRGKYATAVYSEVQTRYGISSDTLHSQIATASAPFAEPTAPTMANASQHCALEPPSTCSPLFGHHTQRAQLGAYAPLMRSCCCVPQRTCRSTS
jgi:hypothetical protein